MAFEHTLTVRFYEIDRAGIAFFGRFFEYCHAAFEEMLTAAFGDLEKIFADRLLIMPLVHVESDFAAPVRIGDRLHIALEVERLGSRSVSFRYRVTGADGVPRASVLMKHAFVDPATYRSCTVPEAFLEGLTKLNLLPDRGSCST